MHFSEVSLSMGENKKKGRKGLTPVLPDLAFSYFYPMNLREALIVDNSKRMALNIADWIGDDPVRLGALMDLFLHGDYRLTQRAAYPLIFLADRNPKGFKAYLPDMFERVKDPVHDAVIRNTLRLFQLVDLPEEIEGPVFDSCLHYLQTPRYPVAIRVFAMTILTNLSLKYPELSHEVVPLIRDILEVSDSPGLVSRGKKELKRLAGFSGG